NDCSQIFYISVIEAVKSLSPMVVGRNLDEIFNNFAGFWRELTSDTQLRWIGPEKGVIHLATAAIVNALWDLWAKKECKPLWKLLVDMDPKKLVSTIDFRYMSDLLTKEEAIEILGRNEPLKMLNEHKVLQSGIRAYTTGFGWIGFDDNKIRKLCKENLSAGFTSFKLKVGSDLEQDKRRLGLVREEIGPENKLMVDANQCWEVPEAIDWMKELAEYKPLWIEEPTSPDDILGHATIAKELNPLGIGVATGEHCHNRVMFKQFLKSGGMQFCQIDCCRLGGVNEVLAVYLMAAKLGIPVCPHSGGVGLCELVQHVATWNAIAVNPGDTVSVVEYIDHLHEHFKHPILVIGGRYMIPQSPGYSSEMKESSLLAYEYPSGTKWKELFHSGKYRKFSVPQWVENKCFPQN
ncbi:mitochondrial enolase superfamily member 1-like, partial [Limulus polyphemus]|uniref:Mitochondrial enolase superfamily member 1-like n=1 Tax=Limulus polyphemus TaxID=6850 RepID=A0ABM1TKM3_LIMPO